MVTITVSCRYCHNQEAVRRKGVTSKGHQRYKCEACKRKPGLIVHSDRGGQYFGQRFRQRLANWTCLQSMAEADNPSQNAHAESFWGRLKAELLDDGCFMNLQDAHDELFNYIEGYYNVRRLHSGLGYRSPIDFENQFYQTNQLNSHK